VALPACSRVALAQEVAHSLPLQEDAAA